MFDTLFNKLSLIRKKVTDVPYDKRSLGHPLFYKLVLNTGIRIAVDLLGKLEVYGEDNVADLEGPYVLAMMHRSGFDVAPLSLAFDRATNHKKQINFLGKKELWETLVPFSKLVTALVGYFFSAVGIFPIDRHRLRLQHETINHIKRILDHKGVIGIFSEGTRGSGDVIKVEDLKLITVYLAAKFGVPIVPVGIHGTEKGHHHKMIVVYGSPIYVQQGTKTKEWATINEQLCVALNNLLNIAASKK